MTSSIVGLVLRSVTMGQWSRGCQKKRDVINEWTLVKNEVMNEKWHYEKCGFTVRVWIDLFFQVHSIVREFVAKKSQHGTRKCFWLLHALVLIETTPKGNLSILICLRQRCPTIFIRSSHLWQIIMSIRHILNGLDNVGLRKYLKL